MLHVFPHANMSVEQLGLFHDIEAFAAYEQQVDFRKNLETRGERGIRLARAFRDRANLTAILGQKGDDQIGFTEFRFAQHQRLKRIRICRHGPLPFQTKKPP